MNTHANLLFSDALYALRRPRIQAADNFLLTIIIEEIEEKLNDVARDFEKVAIIIEPEYETAFSARFPNATILQPSDLPDFLENDYDLVLSIFYLHRANNVQAHLGQMLNHLRPDGLCLVACLGGATLQELRESFLHAEIEIENGASPRVAPMIDTRTAGMLLQHTGFTLPVADNFKLRAEYDSPLALIHDLRKLGLTNIQTAQKKHLTRRDTLLSMMAEYENNYRQESGKISASYELLFLSGWSPHPDQPRPLKPGSAAISLETALQNARQET